MPKTIPRIYRLARRAAERRSIGAGAASWSGAGAGMGAYLPAPVLSGVAVTPETSLTMTAVYACIEARATDLAALPMEVKRRRGKGTEPVPNDPRYDLLYCEPNSDTIPLRFWTALHAHRLGWGNGYAEIKRDNFSGMAMELWLLSPKPMDTWPVKTTAGKLFYKVDGGRRTLPAEDVIHIAGFGWDGLSGYSPIAMARQAIGLGMAAEQNAASFYGNATAPRGALKVQRKLNADGHRNLRESYEGVHQGAVNANRLMILEEGTEFTPFSVNPEEAEWLESRKFQIIEICRMFRVPPPRIMDYVGVAGVYKAFDDLLRDYRTSTIGPDATGAEQECNRKLFTSRERAHGLHVAHDFSAFMKGDAASRMTYHQARLATASITPNQIAEAEGENPHPDPAADKLYLSTTYVPLEIATAPPAPPAPPAAAPDPAEPDADDEGTDP